MLRLVLAIAAGLFLAPATSTAAPARLGDWSLGAGPALVVDRGEVGAGAVVEGDLLWGWMAAGLQLRGAAVEGELRPAASLGVSAFGLVGAGIGLQAAGPSLDLSLQLPLPTYRWLPFYLTAGYRPSIFLEGGGALHQLSLQLRWSSLLLPERS